MNAYVVGLSSWRIVRPIYRVGILVGIITLVAKKILDQSPDQADTLYGGLYLWISQGLRTMTYWVPFPLYYLFWSGLIGVNILFLFKVVSSLKSKKWPELWGRVLGPWLGFVGWVVTAFYLLWGFNYSRPNWKSRLAIESLAIDSTMLHAEWKWVKNQIQQYADSLPIQQARTTGLYYVPETETKLNELCQAVLADFGLETMGKVKVRRLWPGTLLHLSTAGFYLPLTGEANLDAGLHPMQWPYVAAHEIFHGMGVTDEGDCNFLALLACLKSKDPVITYSGLEAYWKELASIIRRANKEKYFKELEQFPPSFLKDLEQIFVFQDRYRDILPSVRHFIYDQYLQSQGIHAGLLSYNQVVALMHHYRQPNAKVEK